VDSARHARWLRLVRGEAATPGEHLAAGGLRALSGLYGAGLALHLAGYRCGLAKRTHLNALVVSVGNLTVGGTGKTTTCLALIDWFLS
jgi:tetraacyldisaccharide-1-P 4'-kinase